MKSLKKKKLIIAGLGSILFLFFYFDFYQILSLENLQARKETWAFFYSQNTWTSIFIFISLYVLMVSASIPVATFFSLAGGAIFGPWIGTIIVNISVTLGATLAFLSARHLLQDWVSEKYGNRLEKIDEDLVRNAVSYIFFLRVVPVFPFFVINLVLGLSKVPLRVYFFSTMLGTLPKNYAIVNAGSQLASIKSYSDIASIGVIGAFVLLGVLALFPAIYNKTVKL